MAIKVQTGSGTPQIIPNAKEVLAKIKSAAPVLSVNGKTGAVSTSPSIDSFAIFKSSTAEFATMPACRYGEKRIYIFKFTVTEETVKGVSLMVTASETEIPDRTYTIDTFTDFLYDNDTVNKEFMRILIIDYSSTPKVHYIQKNVVTRSAPIGRALVYPYFMGNGQSQDRSVTGFSSPFYLTGVSWKL